MSEGVAIVYSEAELQAVVATERERCAKILDAEIERGRSLLALHDKDVRSIYDERTTNACMEAIAYCAQLIRSEPPSWVHKCYEAPHAVDASPPVEIPTGAYVSAQECATGLDAAFADLPDVLRAHPGVKRLHRAALMVTTAAAARMFFIRDDRGQLSKAAMTTTLPKK